MSPRFLIVDVYYPHFLKAAYAAHPGLARERYEPQRARLLEWGFGEGVHHAKNLNEMGHPTDIVIANCEPLQLRWAIENGMPPTDLLGVRRRSWLLKVLYEQVRRAAPDFLYIHDVQYLPPQFLNEIRPYVGMIIGQTGGPLSDAVPFADYDLVMSCIPSRVDWLRSEGAEARYFRLAFEPTVTDQIPAQDRTIPVTFVGGFDSSHRSGTDILEAAAHNLPISFWGYGVDRLDEDSPIRKNYRGEAWGRDMFQLLSQSRIGLNRHIDIAGNFAANSRMFETTGMGALLLTDSKVNLGALFEVGREVVSYESVEECIALAEYYLEHDQERASIAEAGQARTMKEHTFRHRMEEMVAAISEDHVGRLCVSPAPRESEPVTPDDGVVRRIGFLLLRLNLWARIVVEKVIRR